MQFSGIHILAISLVIFGLIWSARLIYKYTKKYENAELFWVVWILVMVLIVGNKFI